MILYHVEHNSVFGPEFHWNFETPRNYYLFVLYRVPTQVKINDSYTVVDAGTCILFDKTATQDYRPAGEHAFIHDYLHFDLTADADRLALSAIPLNTPLRMISPEKISDLISIMTREHHSRGAHSETTLAYMGRSLLYMVKDALQLSRDPLSQDLHFDTLYQLREQIYLYPGKAWSVDTMCRLTHLSSSYLQSLYRSFFHISCARDVINARLRMAASLLQYTNLSIRTIGENCGYANTEHFIRQFHSSKGITPLQFRNAQRRSI